MKIYWFKAQAPLRVLALAKHLGLDPEFIEVDMMRGALSSTDYRLINPNAKAPTLVDGDFILWESGAIMAHLCTLTGSDMWPNDAAGQIEMLRWLACEMPLQGYPAIRRWLDELMTLDAWADPWPPSRYALM